MGCVAPLLIFGLLYLYYVSPALGIMATVGFFIFAIWFFTYSAKSEAKLARLKEKTFSNLQDQLTGFEVTQEYIGKDYKNKMLLDEKKQKVAFIHLETKVVESYDYKNILASEIIVDGKTVESSSKSSLLGGAVLGGLVAGGVGAVIGGLSGKKVSEQEVYSLDLKVIVNNPKNPIKIIKFLSPLYDESMRLIARNKNGAIYKIADREINHWHSILSVLINHENEMEKAGNRDSVVTNTNSVADEIIKLVELKNQGVLSEEEFISQKKKVLKS